MPSIGATLQRILDLAPHYSQRATDEMHDRDQACNELKQELVEHLATRSGSVVRDGLDLKVRVGGRQATYSPLAWIRIYSPRYSPHATAGIYLVYLFAADGSRVYLSLNQGSSEMRSGYMRPVSNPDLLLESAAEARSSLREFIESPIAAGTVLSINLGLANISSVGPYSISRMRNYEYGNILALPYETRHIPADDQLVADLGRMLLLLTVLYDAPAALSRQSKNEPHAQGPGARSGPSWQMAKDRCGTPLFGVPSNCGLRTPQ